MDLTIFLYAVGALCAACGVLGSAFAFWNSLTSKITTNKITAETADKKADEAQRRIDDLNENIAKQREAIAKDLGRIEAFNDGVIQAMEANDRRLTAAVSEMTGSIHHLTERFDRFIERIPMALSVAPSTSS